MKTKSAYVQHLDLRVPQVPQRGAGFSTQRAGSLNVWTPGPFAGGRKHSVMSSCHGGGFA